VWAIAARHAEQANEAFGRCHRLVRAWYKHKGTNNHLLPQNLRSRIWNAHNSAADLWSFFVLTAYLTDRPALESFVRQTLTDDVRLATRVGWLTDDFDIDRNRFVRREPSLNALIFSNSEYVKDGLLPIVELLGHTVWFHRARTLIEAICLQAPIEAKFGRIPSESAEVNGNMLQNLCRFYCATRDDRYREWAFRIADAYFLDALPRCNDLPCHSWDFAAGRPRSDRLSLSDHGNEIIFGLSEAMVLAHHYDKDRAPKYIAAMKRMVDKLLAIAVNEDGLWVHSIQPSTGKVLRRNTPDTWGYALDAVYSLFLVTGEKKYRDAVHRALKGINAKPQYRNWGGADAFADSIEGGIVLLNRIPEPEGFEWLEATVPAFLAKQRPDGIIEGWHGDGNYARTALMYALMKTAGTRVEPWRPDLKLGAVVHDGTLYVQLSADKPWKGTLFFDYPRHKHHFGLPLNYPRLNEYPEWYAVQPDWLHRVTMNGKGLQAFGRELVDGFPVTIGKNPTQLTVRPLRAAVPIEDVPLAAGVRPGGLFAEPYAPELTVETTIEGERLKARLQAAQPWEGVLHFDYPRHMLRCGRVVQQRKPAPGMPRYPVEPVRLYAVTLDAKTLGPMLGDSLVQGLPLKVAAGREAVLVVEPVAGPPYGGKAILIEAPLAFGGDGTVRIPITVRNETGQAAEVVLKTDFGTIEPSKLSLAAGKSAEAVLTGELTKSGKATLEATTHSGSAALHTIRLLHDKNLVGFIAFDDEEYAGRRYQWCGRGPIEFILPARRGQPHTLHLLWGSKNDKRSAVVTINGRAHPAAQGGYTGYRWLAIRVERALVTADVLKVRVEPDPPRGRAAFISEAKLTSP